jgi:hypothetical protein
MRCRLTLAGRSGHPQTGVASTTRSIPALATVCAPLTWVDPSVNRDGKDPMSTYQQTETGYQPDARTTRSEPRRGYRRFTETKAGFKTTEMWLAIVAIAGILIATYVEDANLAADDGWRYATWVAVAYILSRGLAKAGTREPYTDDGN